ncbi:agouti-signaling protein 2b [Salvelinus sp. IW2-2015]|uniref:agouti-signaling protein 2b n=1 Tax=Salvelinus sp. IW2-2015 TaxID=2691554 RepID=UPI0038D400B8
MLQPAHQAPTPQPVRLAPTPQRDCQAPTPLPARLASTPQPDCPAAMPRPAHPARPVWSQGKPRRLFARRKISPHQGQHCVAKHKPEPAAPARRCGRLMESCLYHTSCCDPCASCRCRLFNTVCHCLRLGLHCPKKT